MKKYLLWVCLNQFQTTHTYVYANTSLEAKWIGESQFGMGNILNYDEVT